MLPRLDQGNISITNFVSENSRQGFEDIGTNFKKSGD